MLTGLGLPATSWFGTPVLASCVPVLANCRCMLPFATLIILRGLLTVDTDIYEAAKLDGASGTNFFPELRYP